MVVVAEAGVVEVLPVAALANAAPPPAIAPVTISVAATRMGLTFIDPPLWLEPERRANSLATCRKRRRISRDCVRQQLQRPGEPRLRTQSPKPSATHIELLGTIAPWFQSFRPARSHWRRFAGLSRCSELERRNSIAALFAHLSFPDGVGVVEPVSHFRIIRRAASLAESAVGATKRKCRALG